MPSSPRLLVCGLQGSGTTFAIRLLHECGLDTDITISAPKKKGLEHKALRSISRSALSKMVNEKKWPHEWRKQAMGEFGDRARKANVPEVAKYPSLGIIAILEAVNPAHVLWVYRPAEHRLKGGGADGWEGKQPGKAMYAVGAILDTLESLALPYTVLRYPDAALDADYSWDTLSPLIDISREEFTKAHTEATELDWVRE